MFRKVKTEHHIIKDFHKFLQDLEKTPKIKRIIPGRVHRKQKKTSTVRVRYSYPTPTGLKYKLSKGSTSQELFIICRPSSYVSIQKLCTQLYHKHFPQYADSGK